MTYSPQNHPGNKFFGHWNKVHNMHNMLFWENKEKYLNEFQARFKARLEVGSLPKCFDICINDIQSVGLSSDDKNCLRECYLKRVSARDDMSLLYQQKLAMDQAKALKDRTVWDTC